MNKIGRYVNTDRTSGPQNMLQNTSDGNSSDVECPTCGEAFGSENAAKVHHTKAHGESIAGIEVVCDNCDETFRQSRSQAQENNHHFCDEACMGEWKTKNATGDANPNWSGGKVTVKCANCDDPLQRKRNKVERRQRHFCDNHCQGEWRSEHLTGDDHWMWERVDVNCSHCGKTLQRKPSRVERNDHHFCNNQYLGTWVSENASGEDAPAWDGGDVPIECFTCGTIVYRSRSQVNETNNIFCGRACAGEWKAEHYLGEENPNWSGGNVTVECDNCGSSLQRKPNEAGRNVHNFCDQDCHGEWRADHLTGDAHWLWDGGYTNYYGPSFPRQRRRALERDEYQCQVCDITREEHYDLYGEDLHMHHIIRFRAFHDAPGEWQNHEEANALENLVTMCQAHHHEWEGLSIRPQSHES